MAGCNMIRQAARNAGAPAYRAGWVDRPGVRAVLRTGPPARNAGAPAYLRAWHLGTRPTHAAASEVRTRWAWPHRVARMRRVYEELVPTTGESPQSIHRDGACRALLTAGLRQ